MKIELSREDVEIILKKYFDMDALLLRSDGSAIIDTTLEKIINDNPKYYDPNDDSGLILNSPKWGMTKLTDKLVTKK